MTNKLKNDDDNKKKTKKRKSSKSSARSKPSGLNSSEPKAKKLKNDSIPEQLPQQQQQQQQISFTNSYGEVIEAKHVAENYYSISYGDLMQVVFNKPSGYINVTKLAQDGGKQFSDWKRNKNN